MKRTIPLVITAVSGFVLIVAFFIPATESWGEVAAIWFDILAAIAFILGGGSLVRTHLKKISDQVAGWAYSLITLVAFFVTLAVGLLKIGAAPVAQQEFYGQDFASMEISQFPLTFSVEGNIPIPDNGRLPDSVFRQLFEDPDNGTIVFRGWMDESQLEDLKAYQNVLRWQADVEALYEKAQPPESLQGRVFFHGGHRALAFAGQMTEEDRATLLELSDSPIWQDAIARLYEETNRAAEVSWPSPSFKESFEPSQINPRFSYDPEAEMLRFTGPMSVSIRDAAVRHQFPVSKPLTEARQRAWLSHLRALGPISEEQVEALAAVGAAGWTRDQLIAVLEVAGVPYEVPRTAREMLEDQEAGATEIETTKTVGRRQRLSPVQLNAIREFSEPSMTVDQLVASLRSGGSFSPRQETALRSFLAGQPSAAEQAKDIALAMLHEGPLNREQMDSLLGAYRLQVFWRRTMGELFLAAHEEKYPWSGEYRATGTAFWWLYEYAFKPLTATMFAMLAFYVASAAFRAFRAKNLEAVLLLGTAFIILLGRTFAGVYLTGWLPESLSFLRIEEITIRIMQWFNTAGNRAIMIGIALGIASTSLKVLLGVDRSYLGSGED